MKLRVSSKSGEIKLREHFEFTNSWRETQNENF
jgi:hypothetical protein